ncbi:MAG: hypothetical protein WC867_04150 [Candidatus Pacearchaeota archaeon]|jgi:hypothetical protein
MSLISKLEQGTNYVSNNIYNIAKNAIIYVGMGVSILNSAYSSEQVQQSRISKTQSSKLEDSVQVSPEKKEYNLEDIKPYLGEERIKAVGEKLSDYEKIFNNKPTKEKEIIYKMFKDAKENSKEYQEELKDINATFTLKKDHPELFTPKLPSWIKNAFIKNKKSSNPLEGLAKMQEKMKKLSYPDELKKKYSSIFPWINDFSKLNDPDKYPIYAPERNYIYLHMLDDLKLD